MTSQKEAHASMIYIDTVYYLKVIHTDFHFQRSKQNPIFQMLFKKTTEVDHQKKERIGPIF